MKKTMVHKKTGKKMVKRKPLKRLPFPPHVA